MTNDQPLPKDVPLQETYKVPVDWLRLDQKNPRLVGVNQKTTIESIVAQLYRSEELAELLHSIAANGYLNIEPLIVELDDDQFIVLEGNRRLAAIMLFRDADLVDRISKSERLRITVPELSPEHRQTLDRVSVYRVADRESARSFIGFKHINGAAKWESYAKAKFAADWFRTGGKSLEEIASKIGDRHDTIKRMVAAIYVLEQAEENEIFSLDNRNAKKFNFSHLYTALSRASYMSFLGLDIAWASYEPRPDQIPKEKLPALREVLVWIYGSKEDARAPIIQSQNPDIKRLGEVLTSAEGLHLLRAGRSLDEAHTSTEPADEQLSSSLIRARAGLREAVNNLRGYDGRDESLLNIAEDISETAQTIHDRIKKKFNATTRQDS
ncbi:hypothetical protein UF64_10160 [Thalassospira sp. HJ]|uniref:ParB N-terminal domain-containing protein n=1 Tax=Thalassospira sp. HJ TaxID=1616823 RepID=UPI0005CEF6EC|nr:ParB N-terminal domain-containing protein [Thalassospira sp. HJ]KJE35051.1 hypothetical protein UF64_10160 [Thalassospira sp. HJ]